MESDPDQVWLLGFNISLFSFIMILIGVILWKNDQSYLWFVIPVSIFSAALIFTLGRYMYLLKH